MIGLALLACGVEPAPAPRPNVVVISLDTTRADRIGAYGYDRATTPTIDALAAAGRRYARAYSPLPLTIPAHASLFTGLYPPHHHVRKNGDRPLGPDVTTLAELLRDNGWHTGAATAAFVTTRRWGFDQGFEVYQDHVPQGDDVWHAERPGSAVVDDALAWKRRTQALGPLFLWVHLYDAHYPYRPVEPYASRHEGEPYDGEIAMLDAQVGRLVDAFAGQPTVFVIVGDHGEALGEHGESTHGMFVYEATQRVPLVISGPGVAPAVVDEPVSLVDVLPTILDIVGVSIPPDLDGRPVPSGAPRPVYAETYQNRDRFGIAPHLGVVDGPLSLIATPKPELYDVVADPHQANDLASARPADVARLQQALADWKFPGPEAATGEDAALAAQLASLGYVEGGFGGDTTGPLPDPKDRSELFAKLDEAEQRRKQGDRAGAEALFAELSATYAEVREFRSRRASLLVELGRIAEAEPIVDGVLADDPDSLGMNFAKATILRERGEPAEAAARFEKVAAAAPWFARARAMAVAARLDDADEPDGGPALVDRYAREFPQDVGPVGVYALWLWQNGKLEEARPKLQAALRGERPERGVAFALASLERGRGNVEGARELLQREIAAWPDHREARYAWMRESADMRAWDEVVAQSDVLIALDTFAPLPGARAGADVWHARAQALFNLARYADAREALDAAFKRFPDDSDLWMLEANLRKKEGHDADALVAFERAKALRAKETATQGGSKAP